MKIATMLLLIIFPAALFSQNVLHDPVSNKIFNTDKYSSISGSPFLSDKWQQGSVTTSKGVYKNLALKLDAYSNVLLYNKDDEAYEFQDEVFSFTFEGSKDTLNYRKGLTAPSLRAEQFVQVLVDGKTSLYRSDIKLFAEINQINKGLVKSFSTSTRYFVSKDGNMHLVKLNKQELLDLFADKQSELEAAMKSERLEIKREADVVRLLKLYNSL